MSACSQERTLTTSICKNKIVLKHRKKGTPLRHSKVFLLLVFLGVVGNLMIASAEAQFSPVPDWQPDFSITNDEVLERMIYYFDDSTDIVIFKHGTAVVLPDGLNDDDAREFALKTLSEIYNYHVDLNPRYMDDGNILISYNHPAYNVVIDGFANAHIETIRARRLEALATYEVLIGPMGANKFDEFAMKALYGRTFMFMDAQDPVITKIYRQKTRRN